MTGLKGCHKTSKNWKIRNWKVKSIFRTNLILGGLLIFTAFLISGCSGNVDNPQGTHEQYSSYQNQGGTGEKELVKEDKLPEEALFVCQFTTNQVAVIDVKTGEVVKEIPVGAKPIAVISSPDKSKVYVANSGSGDVFVINTSTGEIEGKIAVGSQPVALTINEEGNILYALDYHLNRVSVVDLKLRSMIGFIPLNTYGFEERTEPPDCCNDLFGEPLGKGRKPSALVLDEEKDLVYVGNMGTWDVAILDLQEEKEINAFDATFGINDMFLAGTDKNLYISGAGHELEINDFILKLDLKGGGKQDKLMVGKKPMGMALSPDGQIIYVITQGEDAPKFSSLNVITGEIISECVLEGELGDLALSGDGSKAFVTDLLNGAVLIIDTRTQTIIQTIGDVVTPKALVYID